MGQIQNLEDLLDFLWRRRWLIVSVTVIGVVLSAIYAKTRPTTYEAAAAIQVQDAQISSDGNRSGAAQMLQSLEQRLTTREALLAMIARHGLYADLTSLSDEEKVVLLRGAVTFQAIESAGPISYGEPAQISAIVILARYDTAEGAARIANDFAQGILDQSASGQLAQAQDTTAFYLEEQNRLTGQIEALESRIADYKNAHADALPAVADARRQEVISIETDLRSLDQRLVALSEEQRQLASRSDLRATDQRRLQEIEDARAVLAEQRAALINRQGEAQTAIARLPEVERDLAGMERELSLLQTSLATVTGKLAEAQTAQRLAERQQGERFALLDRAITPEYPVNASRRKLFAAGALASLLFGAALGFLLDLFRPVVRTSTQMERMLGLYPIAVIPQLDPAALQRLAAPPRFPWLARVAGTGRRILEAPRLVLICILAVILLLALSALV